MVRLPPRQTVRADFPHTALHRVLFLLPWFLSFLRLCCVLYAFFLSIPSSPHLRPREAVEAVVRHSGRRGEKPPAGQGRKAQRGQRVPDKIAPNHCRLLASLKSFISSAGARHFERAADHLGVSLLQHLGVVLEHLAVVGEKAVDLDLHVCRLSVDAAAEPALGEFAEFVH